MRMSLRSASMLSGVRDIPSDLATVASRSSGILLSPHHVTWARYISQRASRLFDAVRRPAVADRYVLRHPLPMNIPPVSARLRDPKLKQSPIREIMKLADRQNVIALGLDPDDVISFAGGWVNHRAPEALVLRVQRTHVWKQQNIFNRCAIGKQHDESIDSNTLTCRRWHAVF